jgi:hypothetical protein
MPLNSPHLTSNPPLSVHARYAPPFPPLISSYSLLTPLSYTSPNMPFPLTDAVPHDMCHLLPDSVCMEDGAMMEPLAVGVHAVSTLGQFKSNESLVVFGAGPVGLLCMAVAKGLGARRVIAVDINEQRLDFAKGYAATDVFIPVSFSPPHDISPMTFYSSPSQLHPLFVYPPLIAFIGSDIIYCARLYSARG